jgi:hypothetical protein
LPNPWKARAQKVYSVKEARALFGAFRNVQVRPQLSHGDLFLMQPSPRYRSRLTQWAARAWPRRGIRAIGDRFGAALLIDATK